MNKFFQPSSIALVGASKRKIGYKLIRNILYGFKGSIYPVNPNYEKIDGLTCYPSIMDIPYPVDLVIILVSAASVPTIIETCALKGINRVMILSAGFAEVGGEGKIIQDRIVAIAKEASIRVWGPNCMGLIDIQRKYIFSFMSPKTYEEGLVPGKISLIVQSGMLLDVFLAHFMNQERVSISKVCSIGNKSDVDECDLLDYLLKDQDTEAVALYLESIPRGKLFSEISKNANKPIVVLKGGRSRTGAQAAISHTSSLSGNSRLADSVMRMTGITLAEDFNQLIDYAKILAMSPKVPVKCETAILTFSGGAGILSCDLLEKHDLRVAKLSNKTLKALGNVFPRWMPVSNPIDLYPAMEINGRVSTYNQAISIVLDDPNVDTLLIHYVELLEEGMPALEILKQKADQKGKVLIFWELARMGAKHSFSEEAQSIGIPVYRDISRAIQCLSVASQYNDWNKFITLNQTGTSEVKENNNKQNILYSYQNGILNEYESKRILAKWNIPVVKEKIVNSYESAEEYAKSTGFPLVLKGLLPGEVHKSESGLVQLGISNRYELNREYRKMFERLKERGDIILQKQVENNIELIAGYLRDDQFGPCIMFGLGGILAELRPDVVFALAPINYSEAFRLLRLIQAKEILDGYRGIVPLKKGEMAEILMKLSQLGLSNPKVKQIDINPLIVERGSPIVVDANIVIDS